MQDRFVRCNRNSSVCVCCYDVTSTQRPILTQNIGSPSLRRLVSQKKQQETSQPTHLEEFDQVFIDDHFEEHFDHELILSNHEQDQGVLKLDRKASKMGIAGF